MPPKVAPKKALASKGNVRATLHSCGDTSALHASTDDGLDVVRIGDLRVVITNDVEHWFAQGLEIDYAAEGKSLEDVKGEFAHGLALTVREHLRVFGDLKQLLRVAPQEIWSEFLQKVGKNFSHTQVTVHNDLRLEFYEPNKAA